MNSRQKQALIGLVVAGTFLLRGSVLPLLGFLRIPTPADFASDYVGARAIIEDRDPYPILGPEFLKLGLNWSAPHRSTHPPTCFLAILPLAHLGYQTALMIWSTLSLACLLGSLWALGVTRQSWGLFLPLLFWSPTLWSLGQWTPLWLFGLCLAWRWRHTPFRSGCVVGIASISKFFALISLGALIKRSPRKSQAIVGSLLVWLVAFAAVVLLAPEAGSKYLTLGDNSRGQILREDNGAAIVVSARLLGELGVGLFLMLSIAVCLSALRSRYDVVLWSGFIWLSVALLPIAWSYSLLPLLPTLTYAAMQESRVLRLYSLVAIFFGGMVTNPNSSPESVAACIGLTGIVVVLLHRYSGRETQTPIAT